MESQNNLKNPQKAISDKPIAIICIALVFIFVAFMAIKPDGTLAVVSKVFDVVTSIMGVPILWFVFIGSLPFLAAAPSCRCEAPAPPAPPCCCCEAWAYIISASLCEAWVKASVALLSKRKRPYFTEPASWYGSKLILQKLIL